MSKYNWDERHIITFPEERWSYRPKICMSIMERTSPLKRRRITQFERIRLPALDRSSKINLPRI